MSLKIRNPYGIVDIFPFIFACGLLYLIISLEKVGHVIYNNIAWPLMSPTLSLRQEVG
jgi:hypothetical protein